MNASGATRDWDNLVAERGQADIDGVTVAPLTPLIGAEVSGLDLTENLAPSDLELISSALLRYKVLMIRSAGQWQMDPDQHTAFCQQLSTQWGLEPDTDQKRMNHSRGLAVHPFLPWLRGYPHIWPTGSVAGGGQQFKLRSAEQVENFQPYANRKTARKHANSESDSKATRLDAPKTGSYGAAALRQDNVNNGANAFHFDDGFFHQPPSAVVLNAIVLPRIGGDTIFTDMGAAFRGLAPDLQERFKQLTQTMDWTHVFPLWELEAERLHEEGDDSFLKHVDGLKQDYPPSLQPLIRQHPVTGELSIYANFGFTRHINDVSKDESRKIMAILCRMAERPEYQVRIRWRDEGDVCIYDNRITNHYAVADYGEVGPRMLHHIALLGEPTKNADGDTIGER